MPDVPATAEEAEIGIIEEDNLPPEPPAPAPEPESALPLPGAEPAFEDVDNPGEWPAECFHAKFAKKTPVELKCSFVTRQNLLRSRLKEWMVSGNAKDGRFTMGPM